MKKLGLSLTLLVLCLNLQVLPAWGVWDPSDGYGGLNVNTGYNAQDPTIAIYNGTPYVAWNEDNGAAQQIYVKYYNGSSWVPANGYGGLNVNNSYSAANSSIAIYNGTPYVAWNEHNGTAYQIFVKYYNGSSWVPSNGYNGLNVTPSYDAQNPSIAIYNGTPYVAWAEAGQIYVKHYNGISWVPANGYGGLDVTASRLAYSPSIAIYNGTPYVVWREQSVCFTYYKIYVKHYNGSSWVPANGYGGLNVNNRIAYSPSIAIYNGTPYVAWSGHNGACYQIYVKYYNGSSWVPSDGYGGLNVNLAPGYIPAIAIYNGTPYVTWRELNGATYQIYVKYYTGSSWVPTDGYGGLNVNSGQHAYNPDIAMCNNVPYVVWDEDNTDTVRQIYLKCNFTPTCTPTITPTPTVTPTFTFTPTITVTSTITPTFTISRTRTITKTFTSTSTPSHTMTITPYLIEHDRVITYPSPARGDTLWFYYYVEESAQIRIEVYNLIGEKGVVLQDSQVGTGYRRTAWDIRGVAGGIYFYRMRMETPQGTRDYGVNKLVIVK